MLLSQRPAMLEEAAEMGQSKAALAPTQTRQNGDGPSSVGHLANRSTIHRALKQDRPVMQHPASVDKRSVTDDPKNSLKRSRDEMERADNSPSSPPSRRPALNSVSPPNLRQSFIPDRGDHWSPVPARRPDYSTASPKSSPRHYRGMDRYVPSARRSPSPRRRLSPTRSSPDPRPSLRCNERPTLGRQDSDTPTIHRNLIWKASDQPSVRQSFPATDSAPMFPEPAAERRAQDLDKATRDYNGLTRVPRGPKHGKIASTSLPDPTIQPPVGAPAGPRNRSKPLGWVEPTVLRSPHIFISSKYLPPSNATVQHLRGCLGQHDRTTSSIFVDPSGYYICFEDTDEGRRRLEKCFTKRNKVMLFRQYTLHMEQVPNGRSRSELNATTEFAQKLNSEDARAVNDEIPDESPDEIPDEAATKASISSPQLDQQPFKEASIERPTSRDPRLHRSSMASSKNGASSNSPPVASVHPLRSSSPFRGPSRQDRDDSSSSISGFTDKSASKRSKCHVCNMVSPFDSDALVLCSSCPRRYHHRCHKQPEIPTNLSQDHSWQCRRCIKKQIRPKSKLSTASMTGNSPAPSVGQAEEPPLKKPRLAPPEPDSPYEPGASNEVLDMVSGKLSPERPADTRLNDSAAHKDALAITESEKPLPGSDDRNFQEADNLVAQSFALPPAPNLDSLGPRKGSGKLSLVRTKVNQSPNSSLEPAAEKPREVSANNEVSTPTESERSAIVPGNVSTTEPLSGKMKTHRWVGGGADKEIIMAGKESFSASWIPSKKASDISANKSLQAQVPEQFDKVPEELTNSISTNDNPQVQEPAEKPSELPEPLTDTLTSQAGRHVSVESDLAKASNNIVPSHEFRTPATPNDSSATQSSSSRPTKTGIALSKRSKPSWDHCTRCLRLTAYNPANTSKLCTECQKAGLTESPVGSSTSEPVRNDDVPRNPSEGPPRNDKQNADGPDIAAVQTAKAISNVISISDVPLEPSESSDSNMKKSQTKLGRACDDCRRRHKTCPHKDPTAKHTSYSRACDDCRRRHITCLHQCPTGAQKSKVTTEMDSNLTAGEEDIEDESSGSNLNLWDSKDTSADAQSKDSSVSQEKDENESQSESQAIENLEVDDSLKTKTPKRISQTRPAIDENDLGDSETRPKNTFVKLISMALAEAPDNTLKHSEVVEWINENIPRYKKGEGSWENSISATLSMNRLKDDGSGYWEKLVMDDAAKKNRCWYRLLPNIPATNYRWDRVRQRPVSPSTLRLSQNSSANADVTTNANNVSPAARTPAGHSPVQQTFRREARDQLETAQYDAMEVEAAGEDDNESSEEEPLSKRKRTKNSAHQTPISPHQDNQANAITGDEMDVDSGNDTSGLAQMEATSAPVVHQRNGKPTPAFAIDKDRLLELIRSEVKNVNFSAQSLFDEWPEYDPANQFDAEAKIAEIKKRPTRKQRFLKPSTSPWMINEAIAHRPVTLDPHRSKAKRSAVTDPAYPWEHMNEIRCKTVEDLFNLPNNPIPIVHEGQLAYRDGTRNDDGSLPRAKVIFKPNGA